ncbi:hypothetical protein LCGC14_0645250 [marine sediment metagenome]|uniref:Uncharacterized protein n=1 Tax=marine sediment metagenome TaxID=412755 RepID=A0A0F9R339_9ZZZZ
MPYSGPDDKSLPSNVKKKSKGKRKQWIAIFNSTFKACKKKGGKKKTCDSKAFKVANGVLKEKSMDNIVATVVEGLRKIIRDITGEQIEARAISIPDAYDKIRKLLREAEPTEWYWITDLYIDDKEMFAVVAREGELFKLPFSFVNDEITIGELSRVVIEFKEIAERSFRIMRQKDGTIRWMLIAGTSVLNRQGEIDSTKLFDSMIEHAISEDEYPYLDFFHLGEKFRMGVADYIARDGVVLIAAGLFEDNPVANAMIKAYETDPDYWGASNTFRATSPPEMLEVATDISIPVYNEGIWDAIAILPEENACSLFTAISQSVLKERFMDKRIVSALTKLAGDDEEAAEEFIGMVDEVNRDVKDSDVIHRDEPSQEESTEEEGSPGEKESSEEETIEGESLETEFELDKEAISQIATQVADSDAVTGFMQTVKEAVEQLSGSVSDLQVISAASVRSSEKVLQRLDVLEKSDEDKQREWENDIPRNQKVRLTTTYRPSRDSTKGDNEKELSLTELASETLANIK